MEKLVILLQSQNSSEKYNIILDTKVLKLFLIGLYDMKAITKRCKDCHFNEEHFNNLFAFINETGKRIIITPYLLAEVSNFLEKPSYGYEELMVDTLKNIQNWKMKEIVHNKKKLIKNSEKCLCKFGFTDASMYSILDKSKEYTMLITTDEPFLLYCYNNNITVRQFPFLA